MALRVAAVGLGWVTLHRHLPWLLREPGVELVGVVDHSPARAEAIAARYGLGLYSSRPLPEDVAWLDQFDAVTIGAPPRAHHALARAYLEAGKHVLVEKPMAMTVEQAGELVAVAERSGRILAVVHNFQFARSVRKLRRLAESGELGTVQAIWAMQLSNPERRLPDWYEDLPLGLFYDESPHLLYLVRALLGAEPEVVAATVVPSRSGRSTPSQLTADLQAGGVPVHLAMGFEAPVSEWHLTVLGTRCLAVVDVFRDILVTTRNDRRHQPLDVLGSSLGAITTHLAGVGESGLLHAVGRLAYGNDEVMHRFASACRDGRPPAAISALDGLRIVQLQHRLLEQVGALVG